MLIDPIQVLVSQIWNAIIISMYREHLLFTSRSLRAPPFVMAQAGTRLNICSEAERRIPLCSELDTEIPHAHIHGLDSLR